MPNDPHPNGVGNVQGRILHEDRLLEALQGRAWIDPQLLD